MKSKTEFLTVLSIALLVVISIGTASAMTLIVRSDADLVEAADLVVHATVLETEPVLNEGGRVCSRAILQVHEVWKGTLGSKTLSITELGGILETSFDYVPGMPVYRPGQEVVVFAVRNGVSWSTLDAWAGAFEVTKDYEERAVLVRAPIGGSVRVSKVGFESFVDSPRDFSGFRTAVVNGFDAANVRDYRLPVSIVTRSAWTPMSPKWKPIYSGTPYRWRQFDFGVDEPWRYGNDPQVGFGPGSTSGDGPAEFARALTTWVADPGSKIHLSDSGRHTPYGTGIAGAADGVSEVLFNDPHGEISGSFNCSSGGVLAYGGATGLASNHSFRGSTFWNVVEGDVVFQNWPSDCAWLNSEDLAEIIAHEVGHALVFGHSYEQGQGHNQITDDALMRWQAHNGSLADTLGEDDQCVAYWLYPAARVDTQLAPNSSAVAAPSAVYSNGSAVLTVTLSDGSSNYTGQNVRASVETSSGSATGTLSRGNAYPDLPMEDNGDGTYSALLSVGPAAGTLTVSFTVNCCATAVPAPPESCDPFSPEVSVTVTAFTGLFADGFEGGSTGSWSTVSP